MPAHSTRSQLAVLALAATGSANMVWMPPLALVVAALGCVLILGARRREPRGL